MKVLLLGDVHTEFGKMNHIINKKVHKVDAIIQTGDFGYWPDEYYLKRSSSYMDPGNWTEYWLPEYIKTPIPLYWVDGNHENHPQLISDTKETNEVAPNCFYQKRGSVLRLGDSNVLFIGGAFSIDKNSRTAGEDWFPEETISQRDIYNLPDVPIDIVISHTGTTEMVKGLDSIKDQPHLKDPSTDALTYVYNKYKPSRWYFGHFHTYQEGKQGDCHWTTIDMMGTGRRNWIITDI